MKNIFLLRLLSLIANSIYMIYGLLLNAPPFIIGCGIAIIIQGFHLLKLKQSQKVLITRNIEK
ncbi:hypothetical protein [Aquimarina litoralis]|uniref:hypothetical protein n=1 Tax=Aquimarina litoralis TaxID=584605 RepID=UPI001C57081C|nr:hypothetical protein [Aquimarina litoralis]